MTEHTKTHDVESTIEKEWSVTVHPDESMEFDPCPYCDEHNIFNAKWEVRGQMVRPPTKREDDYRGTFAMDSGEVGELIHVVCNNCFSVLYDRDGEYPDEQPVEEPIIDYSESKEYDTDWEIIRRSTPAEYVDGISDTAVEYLVEGTEDLKLTIYDDIEADEYVLVGTIWENDIIIDRHGNFEALKSRLEHEKETLNFTK